MTLSFDEPPVVLPVTRLIDQARVDRYAVAARDMNPIHRNTPEALESQFGQPVAHGMLVLSLISEAMTNAFGTRWAHGGSLQVRFRSPALVPVSVTARAALRTAHEGVAVYDVVCEDPRGEVLLSGRASAPFA
jgi:acyl dehydratase